MPLDREDIIRFKEYLLNDRHNVRIKEQKEDQKFFENTYDLPLIRNAEYQIRTGYVSSMVNGITQRLIDKPRIYVSPKKHETESHKKSSENLAKEFNRWVRVLSSYPVNPFQETFRKFQIRGEAWIYVPHKEDLAKYQGNWREDTPDGIPVSFILYDPLVVLADPSEEVDGKPKRLVIAYKRSVEDIRALYPKWNAGKNYEVGETVEFLYYIDKKLMYAEADQEMLFNRRNPYGEVPFVHRYSGWGIETQDKDPALLAFSRIKMIRDMIVEDSSIRSDFMYNFHRFAHRHKTLINTSGQEIGPEAFEEYKDAPDAISILTLPQGMPVDSWKVEESQLFEPAAFAYADRIRADLAMEYPAPLRGVASGTSGRQEDILATSSLTFYDAPLNNNNTIWADAFAMALRISAKIPDMIPAKLSEDDFGRYSEIKVDCKKLDPIEESRIKTQGLVMYRDGIIDLMSLLTEYFKYTEEEAKRKKAKMMADYVIRNSPVLMQLIEQQVAREMDVTEEYEQLKATEKGDKGGVSPNIKFGAQGGEPRTGNIKSPQGAEMSDMMGATPGRRSPTGV